MSNEIAGQRLLSPPHSLDDEYELPPHPNEHQLRLYTPPRSIRPTSSEPPYDQYGSSAYPPMPAMYYPQLATPQPTFIRNMTDRRSVAVGDAGVTTRSGRSLRSPTRSSRQTTPRRRKNRKQSDRPAMLMGPISDLTKDYDIPLKDMDAHVNRTFEEREKEIAARKRKGKENDVPRPSNSFILYRMCYQERIKEYMRGNNHQDVSKIGGASWALEPKEVRDRFERLAIIERDNHTATFPAYKFQPNKAGKKRVLDDDDEGSDLEWEGGSRTTKRSRREHTRSTTGTPFDEQYAMQMYGTPPPPHMNQSSYYATNPHGPAPYNLGAPGMDGYYATQATSYAPGIHDIRYERMSDYPQLYDDGSGLIGMPDAGSHNLLGSPDVFQPLPPDALLDPALGGQHYGYVHFDGQQGAYHVPRSVGYSHYPDEVAPQHHPGDATLSEAAGGWQGGQAGLDFDRALDGL